MASKVSKTYVHLSGKRVPTKIYWERRNNVRASIGKRAAILRMPLLISPDAQETQMRWFVDWVKKQFSNNQELQERFFGKGYKSGDVLQVGERQYQIEIEYSSRKTHTGKLKNGIITLQLSQNDQEPHLQKSIKHLLSRLVGQDFSPSITRKVNEINQLYFQKPINSVNLKYNQSNWGSCSTRGNINLSTRLLFAPEKVIDYVIIHELAHLIEMNHSSRFWEIVREAMPDYKACEEWLKKNGKSCNF